MSMIGFRCPDGRNVSVVECLSNKACTRKCLPTVFRIGILLKSQWRDPQSISVTNLTSPCMRKVFWEKIRPYHVEPTKRYSSLRGSLLHEIIALVAEQSYQGDDELCKVINDFTSNLLVEKHFRRPINGISLSGQIDLYNKKSEEIIDLKTIAFSSGILKEQSARQEHIAQVNLYAHLLRGNGFPVKKLRIAYISMNAVYLTGEVYEQVRKLKSGIKKTTAKIADVPLWSEQETIAYIEPRIKVLHDALSACGKLPAGVDEESGWICSWCPFSSECDSSKTSKQEEAENGK